MGNVAAGVGSEVIVGPARLLIAPIGTTLPTIDGLTNPVVWDAAWKEAGYTEDGTNIIYAPTVKDIMVDETPSPIKKILDAEKATISCKVAQATLDKLNYAISASILTSQAADATHAQFKRLDVGTGTLKEFMVGLEGLSPTGLQRIIYAYRGMSQAQVELTFKRSDKTLFALELGLLADSTQPLGKQLYAMFDILAPHT